MKNYIFVSSFVFFVILTIASSQDPKDLYFEGLIDYLYQNYPDFIPRLLAYNGTRFNNKVAITNVTVYKNDYVSETKFTKGYSVFVANGFQHKLKDGLIQSSTYAHNTMYKCESVIRYCTGNPAYCRYHEGEKGTQIILTAGHDGPLRPKSIPNRGTGCLLKDGSCLYRHDCENTTANIFKNADRCKVKEEDDVETTDIAVYMAEALAKLTRKRPHLIISRVHRKKLDVNRDISMGTFHVPEAVKVYNDVHGYIKQAKASFDGDWGILLDIHGNNLPEKWTMLGYGVLKYQFDQGYFTANDSTIKNLAEHVDVDITKLLRGKNSLGHLMEERGIKVIPSPRNPKPEDQNYLTGGYITRHHGSRNGGNIDALQIEIPVNDRDNKSQKERYLNHLCEAIVEFINMNYNRRGGRGKEKGKRKEKRKEES